MRPLLAALLLASCADPEGGGTRKGSAELDDSAASGEEHSGRVSLETGQGEESGEPGGESGEPGGESGEPGGDDTAPAGPADADGDGYAEDVDCEDLDAGVHPGASETCDGEDDDCDGSIDPAAPSACPDAEAAATSEGGGLVALDAAGFVLQDEDGWEANTALIDALAATLPTVSVAELVADGNRDGEVISASELSRATGFQRGFTWNSGDIDVDYWYPQGITGTFDADPSGLYDGVEAVVVSWHYDPEEAGTSYDKGVRLSFADISSGSSVSYRHVLLVEPSGSSAAPDIAPVEVHAGGIAWVGDWLYVADTNNGLRVFDLNRVLQVSTDSDEIGCSGGVCNAYNYKYVLPQVTRYALPACSCDAKFSFVGLDASSSPPSLVTGEYDSDAISGLLLRWPLDPATGLLEGGASTTASEAFVAQQDRVQGAASVDGQWWLSCSSQTSSYGKLYEVTTGGSTGYTWVYGPEDLAVDAANGWLWSLTEHPGDRAVFAVDLAEVGG